MTTGRLRTLCTFALAAAVFGLRFDARAQSAPVPPPAPVPSAAPVPSPIPPPPPPPAGGPQPSGPTDTATQPPIIVEPPSAGVTVGGTQTLRVMRILGSVVVTVADPSVADVSIDQATRLLTVTGRKIGNTVATVRDDRGLTREVPIRVAYPAGSVADVASVRVTGRPASAAFLRGEAIEAALARATVRPGASIAATRESVTVNAPLRVDDVTTIDVPLIISGGEQYFTVQGTTRVRVENFAQPSIRPKSLLVSDFPETLKENGILFTADLTAKESERFLYYHYNPGGQPARRIVLKAQNPSSQPALVQRISGRGGPGFNEMEVGHLATQRFLVHVAQNEGTVITIPANATVSLMSQELPPKTTASGLLQLHEIEGAPLHLTLVAQNATDPIDGPIPSSALLVGDRPHARGIYPIPEFFFDYAYDAEGPTLEIPIGQIPLPNLVQGQTLAGDYGVLQSVTVRMINNDRHNARAIALYASPRGGRATGTFVIDRVLVQAHAMSPFGHYKLRQYTIPPGSYVRTEIVTMPEGGSSYPLRLVVAPDDGSAAPGSADSPVY
ncbi:MAG: hypothetical protein NVSMB19_03190 [Vulcanimicrobiaceae bacterium]